MSTAFRFYDATTGVLHDKAIATDAADPQSVAKFARANAPAGHIPIQGAFDPLSQRVDVATGKIIDYQPPAPSADHEWDLVAKRWTVKAAVMAREKAKATALARIDALDRASIRAGREMLLGVAGAHDRLARIEAQIAQLRESF
jgi:hypothetical protein